MWFINEESEPYFFDGTRGEQIDRFPDDCHTPYDTWLEADEASLLVCLCNNPLFNAR